MTTDTRRQVAPQGARALATAVAATGATGLVVAVTGLLAAGQSALLGAAVGTGLAILVLATGLVVVDLVATTTPALSLLVALLTYTLQVGLLASLLSIAGQISGTGELSQQWFAGAVIAVALAWTVSLVWHAMRLRIPAFDLPAGRFEGSPR